MQRIHTNTQPHRSCFYRMPWIVLLFTGLLLACSTPNKPEPGYVQKEWSKNMRELAIYPIFPAREDVKVGDVYLFPVDPAETTIINELGGIGRTGLWLHFYDELKNTVSDFYKNDRSSFPPIDDSWAGSEGILSPKASEKIFRQPPHAATENIFLTNDTGRLRLVAFPEFTISNVSYFEMGALVPLDAITIAFGGARADRYDVQFKIPAAESYGIPASKVFPLLSQSLAQQSSKKQSPEEKVIKFDRISKFDSFAGLFAQGFSEQLLQKAKTNKTIQQYLRDHFHYQAGNKQIEKKLWIMVINEVFYARALDISIVNNTTTGATLRAQMTSDALTIQGKKEVQQKTVEGQPTSTDISSNSKAKDITSTTTTIETKGQIPVDLISPNASPSERVEAMNAVLESIGQQTVAGGSIRFISSTKNSVSMRRIYDRPVAVGVRGMVFSIYAGKNTDATYMTIASAITMEPNLASNLGEDITSIINKKNKYLETALEYEIQEIIISNTAKQVLIMYSSPLINDAASKREIESIGNSLIQKDDQYGLLRNYSCKAIQIQLK